MCLGVRPIKLGGTLFQINLHRIRLLKLFSFGRLVQNLWTKQYSMSRKLTPNLGIQLAFMLWAAGVEHENASASHCDNKALVCHSFSFMRLDFFQHIGIASLPGEQLTPPPKVTYTI